MYEYKLTVMFKSKTAGKEAKEDYCSFLKGHNAVGIEEIERNVSRVHFRTGDKLDEKVLREELKSLKLVRFYRRKRFSFFGG